MKIFNNLKLKANPFLLLVVAFTITMTSCEKPNKPNQNYEEPSKELLKHIIPLEKAVETYKLYQTQRLDILKEPLRKLYRDSTFNDTRMVWFDIETIKEYIAYVEKESKDAKIKPDGLQFYFSVYTDKDEEKNHQTFFIAPTKANGENHSGYTLDSNGNEVLLKDKLKSRYRNSPNQSIEKASFFSFVQEDIGLLLNGGGGTPPNDNDN